MKRLDDPRLHRAITRLPSRAAALTVGRELVGVEDCVWLAGGGVTNSASSFWVGTVGEDEARSDAKY